MAGRKTDNKRKDPVVKEERIPDVPRNSCYVQSQPSNSSWPFSSFGFGKRKSAQQEYEEQERIREEARLEAERRAREEEIKRQEAELARLRAEEARQQEEMERQFAEQLIKLEFAGTDLINTEKATHQKKVEIIHREEQLEAQKEKVEAQLEKEKREKEDKEMESIWAKREEELLERERQIDRELQLKKHLHNYQLKKDKEEAREAARKERAQIEAALKQQRHLMDKELRTQRANQAADFAKKEKEAFAETQEWKEELRQRQEEQAILDMIEDNELKMEAALQMEANRKAAEERTRQYTEERKEQMKERLEETERKARENIDDKHKDHGFGTYY